MFSGVASFSGLPGVISPVAALKVKKKRIRATMRNKGEAVRGIEQNGVRLVVAQVDFARLAISAIPMATGTRARSLSCDESSATRIVFMIGQERTQILCKRPKLLWVPRGQIKSSETVPIPILLGVESVGRRIMRRSENEGRFDC